MPNGEGTEWEKLLRELGGGEGQPPGQPTTSYAPPSSWTIEEMQGYLFLTPRDAQGNIVLQPIRVGKALERPVTDWDIQTYQGQRLLIFYDAQGNVLGTPKPLEAIPSNEMTDYQKAVLMGADADRKLEDERWRGEQTFRQNESKRTQANADRIFGLQDTEAKRRWIESREAKSDREATQLFDREKFAQGKYEFGQQYALALQRLGLDVKQAKQQADQAEKQYALDLRRFGLTERLTQSQIDLAEKQYGLTEEESKWQRGQTEREFTWKQEQAEKERAAGERQEALTREQFGWQQSQVARQEEMERTKYGAQLAAQPRSWLEYHAFTKTPPVVQPWMTPLMGKGQGAYGGSLPGWPTEVGLKPGEQITGMEELPELTRPSAQYWSQIGPTAQEQYKGYQQARTGATPEETLWRLRQTAPPGAYRGLSYRR